ncbi:hypothetical protein [Thermoplasma volcanium GSS1]|uniref:Uroporphyrin-III C-methyltransferase n=1 Tax=Thermoplasma volcanium (strain ATCC 51530 / DSM 4299 / JCM 9571 / NBRC 15438 / GSS1) TaxID=273116 RepID=Q978M0_THEVO|nr:DUF488 domain-containing protein [Thermoplasma volcanium]BAB60537.1 hypothetical protein [Thermoplasma volcanium GSS1]
MLSIKRVYENRTYDDGYRVLVERLWPRGITKERAALDAWYKDIAPSDSLRKWFSHDERKWDEFKERYMDELCGNKALEKLVEIASQTNVTLIISSRSTYNNAEVLKYIIENYDEFKRRCEGKM